MIAFMTQAPVSSRLLGDASIVPIAGPGRALRHESDRRLAGLADDYNRDEDVVNASTSGRALGHGCDGPDRRSAVMHSARCETAPDGVEMCVTRAKQVSPTPPGGGATAPAERGGQAIPLLLDQTGGE
jgi:hypothetical protein